MHTSPRPAWVILTLAVGVAGCRVSAGPAEQTSSPPRVSHEWTPPSAPAPAATPAPREACAHHEPLRQAFFGDLHTHTAFSLDALFRGGFQTPDDAYRFARGEPIGLSPVDDAGQPTRRAQLDRPLDFAAVTDHSEWLGEVAVCTDATGAVYDTPACRGLRPGFTEDDRAAWLADFSVPGRGPAICGEDWARCRDGLATAWSETRAAAERHYDRSSACSFTTFHGWEYTRAPERSMTHRNIILRNEITPELPISWIDAADPEDLWTRLKERCNDNGSGCEALSIPHNPNISNGRLFTLDWGDASLGDQRAAAALRAEMEPLVEMMQAKGASECRRGMWGVVGGNDALCDFEQARFIDDEPPPDCEDGVGAGALRGEGCQSRLDFARYALIEGLAQEARLGVNPLQLGFIASTDGHNGAPGDTDEYAYQGHNSNDDADLNARLTASSYVPHRRRNPGGLVGVWAEENSRDSVFDALQRRETFGTSGVRIQVRLFGGWRLPDLCASREMIAEAYETGVPMGEVLPPREAAAAPMLFVTALADPGTRDFPGTPLQRIQIIKGWVGDDGRFHEQVVDVAGGENGADVSRNTCAREGSGAGTLCAVWTDPKFDPTRSAVYYARVLENPSCRWDAWQCAALPGSDRPAACFEEDIPWKIQERAWTSPIWYRAVNPSP